MPWALCVRESNKIKSIHKRNSDANQAHYHHTSWTACNESRHTRYQTLSRFRSRRFWGNPAACTRSQATREKYQTITSRVLGHQSVFYGNPFIDPSHARVQGKRLYWGVIVNIIYDTHENLYFLLFLVTIFGPIFTIMVLRNRSRYPMCFTGYTHTAARLYRGIWNALSFASLVALPSSMFCAVRKCRRCARSCVDARVTIHIEHGTNTNYIGPKHTESIYHPCYQTHSNTATNCHQLTRYGLGRNESHAAISPPARPLFCRFRLVLFCVEIVHVLRLSLCLVSYTYICHTLYICTGPNLNSNHNPSPFFRLVSSHHVFVVT